MFEIVRHMMGSITKVKAKPVEKAPSKVEPQKPKEPKVVTAKVAGKKSNVAKFCGVKHSYHHPFQKVLIPAGGTGVLLDDDSWLECQIKAGLIKKL